MYEAKQILTKVGGQLELKQGVLDEILKPAENLPVAIISIYGNIKNGKSFLLNLFLRHLVKIDARVSEYDEVLNDVFKWRAGVDRMTEGIWMLNTPIIVKRGTKKIALYLMDTQGMFDRQTSKKECAQIFALVTLMSSYLVFNMRSQIETSDIDYLEFWTSTAKWAEEEGSSALFQNFLVLLRDFLFVDMGYGLQGGKHYLDEMFNESTENASEVNQSISNLKRVFEQVTACALPRPSEAVAIRRSNAESIVVDDVGADFLKYSLELFKHLAGNVKPLNITGSETTGKELKKIISHSCKTLLGNKMPNPVSLSNEFVKFQLSRLSEKEAKKYEKNMEDCGGSITAVELLQRKHTFFVDKALYSYDNAKKIGSKAVIEAKRVGLQVEINKLYQDIFKLFNLKRELLAFMAKANLNSEKDLQQLKRQIYELEKNQKRKADKL